MLVSADNYSATNPTKLYERFGFHRGVHHVGSERLIKPKPPQCFISLQNYALRAADAFFPNPPMY